MVKPLLHDMMRESSLTGALLLPNVPAFCTPLESEDMTRAKSAPTQTEASHCSVRGAQENLYFQRIRFDLSDLVVGASNTAVLERAIGDLAKRYDMQWRIFYDSKVPRAQDADVMMCTVSFDHV